MGKAIINPESSGFFPDNQLAKAITKAASSTFVGAVPVCMQEVDV